jgi:hypothetical protein
MRMQGATSLPHRSEIEDADREIAAAGLQPQDFTCVVTDETDFAASAAIRYVLDITYTPTGHQERLHGGHGQAWSAVFGLMVGRGQFRRNQA